MEASRYEISVVNTPGVETSATLDGAPIDGVGVQVHLTRRFIALDPTGSAWYVAKATAPKIFGGALCLRAKQNAPCIEDRGVLLWYACCGVWLGCGSRI